MHTLYPFMALAEDADVDDWICGDLYPWHDIGEDVYTEFEAAEQHPTDVRLEAFSAPTAWVADDCY